MADYFFTMPSFLRGAARTLDLGAGLQKGSYLISDYPAEANARALESDWAAVDGDLAVAASRIANEQAKEKQSR